ncbi:MAG TPA: hypothetical protein VFV00_05525 [Acidimicrobiales bacterium]|nr:hypothetical protein [Acidimicrobiales bacterium]
MDDVSQGSVLVDLEVDEDGEFEVSFLTKVGHPVVLCHGPGEHSLCPLLAGQGCVKFDEAHGIVFELDLDRPQHRAIVEKYRDLAADMPIGVVVQAEQVERYVGLLADLEVWTRRPTAADLDGFAAEVEAADRFS